VDHKIGAGQNGPYYLALYSDSPAVDDSDIAETQLARFFQIGFDHALDVSRRHAVQVEDIGNGYRDWLAGVVNIARHVISLYRRNTVAAKYTYKQGQYLAYIFLYTKLHGRPPAELDIQERFRVSAPSVHQMILTLEARGLISRIPWTPRSIQVLVPREELPDLD
jgi:hypothetical protein